MIFHHCIAGSTTLVVIVVIMWTSVKTKKCNFAVGEFVFCVRHQMQNSNTWHSSQMQLFWLKPQVLVLIQLGMYTSFLSNLMTFKAVWFAIDWDFFKNKDRRNFPSLV